MEEIKQNTLYCLNIFGLLLMNNRNKPTILGHSMMNDSTICAFITETWISDSNECCCLHIASHEICLPITKR